MLCDTTERALNSPQIELVPALLLTGPSSFALHELSALVIDEKHQPAETLISPCRVRYLVLFH